MNGSATAIWIICTVAVAGLVIWLGSVALAARKPYQEHAHGEPLRGTVQGGMHVGAGRSVAPRRDEPVTPGTSRAGKTPAPTLNSGTPGRTREPARPVTAAWTRSGRGRSSAAAGGGGES
jgi:hypothetical protein